MLFQPTLPGKLPHGGQGPHILSRTPGPQRTGPSGLLSPSSVSPAGLLILSMSSIPVLEGISCETPGKRLNLSESLFPHLSNGCDEPRSEDSYEGARHLT